MAKASSATSAKRSSPELSAAQKTAVERLTRVFPEPKPLSSGEVAGLGQEALEGYQHGQRVRYDSQGREWMFQHLIEGDQYKMDVAVTFFGVPLGAGKISLDRIAGKEGEDDLLALVERLAAEIGGVQAACRATQMAMQSEADAAVAPLMTSPEDFATSPEPGYVYELPPGAPEQELGLEPEPEPPKPEPEPAPEVHKHRHSRWR